MKKPPSSILKAAASVLTFPWAVAAKRRRAQRKALFSRPFPSKWIAILEQNVPFYRSLDPNLRRQLHGHIQVFLNEKKFEGCEEIEITDEVRLIVAAHACLLLLNREASYYPRLSTILIYPHAYVVEQTENLGSADLVEDDLLAGESWDRDYVVLSWDDVEWSLQDPQDGFNVILHEFAHQLDDENGVADGAPLLEKSSDYKTWARVLRREYAALQRKVRKGQKSVIDEYGADDPSEFFAVLTETFFEKPRQLKKKHPKLYEEMEKFYRLNPAEWPT